MPHALEALADLDVVGPVALFGRVFTWRLCQQPGALRVFIEARKVDGRDGAGDGSDDGYRSAL